MASDEEDGAEEDRLVDRVRALLDDAAVTESLLVTEEGAVPARLGSRHRAAAGISIESDCLVVIVSEETGAISIAEQGRIEHDIPRDAFRATLARRLATAAEDEADDREAAPAEPAVEERDTAPAKKTEPLTGEAVT